MHIERESKEVGIRIGEHDEIRFRSGPSPRTARRTADELAELGDSFLRSRRRPSIPVLVVTSARGADENWLRLQQNLASLSERGCLITAQQSGHVVATDQPAIIVDAIRPS